MSHAHRTRGFTLVELLVVIGIIALLISILLPSLNRARETANRVKCGSNMRQVGQAMLLYANENHGRFPRTIYQPNVAPNVTNQGFASQNPPSGPRWLRTSPARRNWVRIASRNFAGMFCARASCSAVV